MEPLVFEPRQPDRIPGGYYLQFYRWFISELDIKDIAADAAIGRGYLTNIERGANRFPLPRLESIAAAYGLSTGIVAKTFGLDQSALEDAGITLSEPTDAETFLYELLSSPEDVRDNRVVAEIINSMAAKFGDIVE